MPGRKPVLSTRIMQTLYENHPEPQRSRKIHRDIEESGVYAAPNSVAATLSRMVDRGMLVSHERSECPACCGPYTGYVLSRKALNQLKAGQSYERVVEEWNA